MQIRGSVAGEQNGRGKVVGRERKQILSMLDAPDDVYFIATDATRYVTRLFHSAPSACNRGTLCMHVSGALKRGSERLSGQCFGGQ